MYINFLLLLESRYLIQKNHLMKKLIFLALLISFSISHAQSNSKLESARNFQKEINREFRDPEESPLSEEERENFEGLEFFDIDTNYVIKADFVRTPSEAPFQMATSTDRRPVYVKYGEVYFELKGKKFKLNIYQNQSFLDDPEYYNYLFLPFTDKTNGETTYSGGRYLDLRIPEGDFLILDFNKAYNPYCAYSANYSCPIPPEENNLEVAIPVGVKAYGKH